MALATLQGVTEPATPAAKPADAVLGWPARILPLALTFSLGVSISLAAFFLVRTTEQQRVEREFDWRARSHFQTLRTRVDRLEECLYTMRDLYYATAHVSAWEFRDTATDLIQRHPGIYLLQWLPEVSPSERLTFEATANKKGFHDYLILEKGEGAAGNVRAGDYPSYAPVLYVEPRDGHEDALGMDWYRGPYAATLAQARDGGEITATDRIPLTTPPSQEFGWAMFLPLYTSGPKPDSPAERQRRLRGYIEGTFRLPDLVAESVRNVPWEGLETLLVDETKDTTEPFLITFANGTWKTSVPPARSDFAAGLNRTFLVKVGGRDWRLYFRPSAAWLARQNTPYPYAALAGGLLLTALVASLVFTAQRRGRLVARLVEQRTAELCAVQETLHGDIHRRESVEEALRESDDRYRAFVAQSTEAIWRFEFEPGIATELPVEEQIDRMYASAHLAECNDIMAQMYGYGSAAEMVGVRIEQIAPRRDPQNAAYFRRFVENGYRIAEWETHEVDRHGDVKCFLNNKTGIVENGLLKRVWGTQRDITERKRQAELQVEHNTRLRLAVAAANLGTWDWDLRTGRIVWSRECEIMYGLEPGTFDGRLETYLDFIHPDDRKNVRGAVEISLKSDTAAGSDYRFRIIRPDGNTRWLVVRGTVLRDEQGVPIRRLGTVMDVTAQRLAEEEKARIEHKLQETQKLESLGVLAGGIAHDFNNLLTGILGNASLARLDLPANSPAQPSLEQIELVAQRAADLCKQMLAYSGKGRFIVQRLDLSALVRDTADLLRLSISKNAVLKFSLAAGLPSINADATQMRQILMNLIINASEAIGEKSGVITVATGVMQADRAYLTEAYLSPNIPEGDYVFLEVSDNGSGMDAETRERIFDPFFTTKFTGRGLGLAAVLGIVRGHQGALKVYSELGHGTSFKLLLPRAEGAAEQVPSGPESNRAWRGAGTMLVVDDEDSVRIVSGRMLTSMGFHVLLASNGEEALEIFLPHRDEIVGVLLDLTMPQLDGTATFAELRRIKPDIRVLLMSGFNEQDAVNRFAGKGLAGFIQKPFKPETLQARLRAIFEVEPDNQLSLLLDPPVAQV